MLLYQFFLYFFCLFVGGGGEERHEGLFALWNPVPVCGSDPATTMSAQTQVLDQFFKSYLPTILSISQQPNISF
jgi:hypothetical protein